MLTHGLKKREEIYLWLYGEKSNALDSFILINFEKNSKKSLSQAIFLFKIFKEIIKPKT